MWMICCVNVDTKHFAHTYCSHTYMWYAESVMLCECSHNISLAHKHVVWYVVVVVVVVSVMLCECSHNIPLTHIHVVWYVVVVVSVTWCESSHNLPLTHIHVVQPIADRVAQNLEIIAKTL